MASYKMDYKFMGEESLRKSGLAHYVIVRPGGLAGGEGEGSHVRPTDVQPGTQHLVYGHAEADLGAARSIHRTDVAAVVCEALASSDAAGKTIEIVARPKTEGEPTIAEQVSGLFKSLPTDALLKLQDPI
eukprot:TRINITY_DN34478_c0_g1_i2.p2 TRINITY_DN34478_c0_g1~~TRINITY_DN34478_c0_g1_i2.p2  ORF type:complete len:130 (-),score=20.37 TRINITY_DN34478_c0_g1_i2:87-476(-)